MDLILLPGTYAICRLAPDAQHPKWAASDIFCSVTYTQDECSIICPIQNVPSNVQTESSWRGLRVHGPLDFAQTGVVASLAQPMAEAHISIFTISTFDTDYLFIRQENFAAACSALKNSGHHIHQE